MEGEAESWFMTLVDVSEQGGAFFPKGTFFRGLCVDGNLVTLTVSVTRKIQLSTDVVVFLDGDTVKWLQPIQNSSDRVHTFLNKDIWEKKNLLKHGCLINAFIRKKNKHFDARVAYVNYSFEGGIVIDVEITEKIHDQDKWHTITLGDVRRIVVATPNVLITAPQASGLSGAAMLAPGGSVWRDPALSQSSEENLVHMDDEASHPINIPVEINGAGTSGTTDVDMRDANPTQDDDMPIGEYQLNVTEHRRTLRQHWFQLVRTPDLEKGIQMLIRSKTFNVKNVIMLMHNQRERNREYLLLLLRMQDADYFTYCATLKSQLPDVWHLMTVFEGPPVFAIANDPTNAEIASKCGINLLFQRIKKDITKVLDVETIMDIMFQHWTLHREHVRSIQLVTGQDGKIDMLLSCIQEQGEGSIANFLSILQFAHPQVYELLQKMMGNKNPTWQAVLAASHMYLSEKINTVSVKHMQDWFVEKGVLGKEEYDILQRHEGNTVKQRVHYLIDILVGNTICDQQIFYEALCFANLKEIGDKLWQVRHRIEKDAQTAVVPGACNATWIKALSKNLENLAKEMKKVNLLTSKLHRAKIISDDADKQIQNEQCTEHKISLLIDGIQIMGLEGRKVFLDILDQTENKEIRTHLEDEERAIMYGAYYEDDDDHDKTSSGANEGDDSRGTKIGHHLKENEVKNELEENVFESSESQMEPKRLYALLEQNETEIQNLKETKKNQASEIQSLTEKIDVNFKEKRELLLKISNLQKQLADNLRSLQKQEKSNTQLRRKCSESDRVAIQMRKEIKCKEEEFENLKLSVVNERKEFEMVRRDFASQAESHEKALSKAMQKASKAEEEVKHQSHIIINLAAELCDKRDTAVSPQPSETQADTRSQSADSDDRCLQLEQEISRLKEKESLNLLPFPKIQDTTPEFYREKQQQGNVYMIRNHTRSRACVINMTENRDGWQQDVIALEKLFKTLKYPYEIWCDSTKDCIDMALERFSKHPFNMFVDSVFVIFMAHGGTDEKGREFIQTGDGEKLFVRETIENLFNEGTSPHLSQKPKIFLLQVCRGTGVTYCQESRPRVEHDAVNATNRKPLISDYLFAYASQPGRASMRHTEKGSWLIQEFVNVLLEEAHDQHVVDMFTEINRRVMEHESERKAKAFPEQVINLQKKFYLFPGIFPDANN